MATQFTRLLGRLEVQLGGRQSLPTGQVAQFLGYLAYHAAWVGRGELSYLFWPDQPEVWRGVTFANCSTGRATDERARG